MAKSKGQKRRREAEADLDQETAAAVTSAVQASVGLTTTTQNAANDDNGATKPPPSKKSRIEERRSLFVRSLPANATSESLTDFFSQHYPVKHATVVIDRATKQSRGYGFVTFTDADDAIEAKKALNGHLMEGRKLVLDVAEPRHRAAGHGASAVHSGLVEEKRKREEEMAEARKAPKLIVRNLPWSIKTGQQLERVFMRYGKVKFADLPSDKGKMKGFGFVTFRSRKHAEKAVEDMNGREIDGRPVAVDWAVSKDEWEQVNGKREEERAEKTGKPKKVKKEKSEDGDKNLSQEDKDLAEFMKKMEDFDSENDDDDDAKESDNEDDEEDDDEDLNDLDSNEDGKDDDDEEKDSEDESEEEQKPKRTTDNSTTIFIRNLPFTATDESLKEHFTQFGPLRYARVVKDRVTDKPAGTGFVCFVQDADFKACLRSAPRRQASIKPSKPSVLQDDTIDTDGRYTLDGRVLQVTHAVSKEEATKLTEAGPARENSNNKDKRRLFLLAEGTIPKNSPLYALLTPAEVKLREQSAAQRKKQVQTNPSLHLSLTRLAIRNLPHNMTSKDLKQLARQAVVGFASDVRGGTREALSKEELARGGAEDRDAEHRRKEKGRGVVKQAKVVFETREGKKVDETTGAGRSRGYGFVEYSSHRWALMGLRWLNGHALKNEAGKTVRLVVEFAIENAQVVSRRRANEVRARTKRAEAPQQGRGNKFGSGGKPEKKGNEEAEEQGAAKLKRKDASEKLAQRQRIIGRKRMARKAKKVGGRKG